MRAARLSLLEEEAKNCERCVLAQSRTNVVFSSGDPDAALMVVGEAPGKEEDLSGAPFVGRSGRLLVRLLDEVLGLDRDNCYIANCVKCRPPANRNPRPAELAACRPFLDAQIDAVAPKVIVTLGNVATRSLLATHEGIGVVREKTHSSRGTAVVATYHPAAALRGGEVVVAALRADLARAKEFLT